MMWLCGCRVSGSVLVVFFFFKQKTAYEMRMSDWSSDVCSSDLQCSQLSGLWARANGCGDPGSYSSCKGHPPSARSTAPGSHRLKYAGLNIQSHPVGDQRRRCLARDPGIIASAVAHAPYLRARGCFLARRPVHSPSPASVVYLPALRL